jgi:hypothetical protein
VCTLQGLPVAFALTGAKESVSDTPKGQLDLEQHGGHTPAEWPSASCSASSR